MNTRKFFVLLCVVSLVLCAVFALAACNNDNNDQDDDETTDIGLTLSTYQITLTIPDFVETQLSASTKDDGKYIFTFQSDNTSVAKVSNTGLVTGMGNGTANITVSARAKGTVKVLATQKCVVTVTAPENYYSLTSASSANVIANPGTWFVFANGSKDSCNNYCVGDTVNASYKNYAVGKKWYLRYWPEGAQNGDAYKISFNAEPSVTSFLRVSVGTDSKIQYFKVEGGKTNKIETICVLKETCFSVSLLSVKPDGDGDSPESDYITGNFDLKLTDIKFEKQISLSKTETEINLTSADKTFQLTAKNAAGTIGWSSNNETVATVDQNGLVTAVSEGTAVITANDGTNSATCTVTVLASKLSISQSNLLLDLSEKVLPKSATLKADAAGFSQDTVAVWSSDNESVATVSNTGVVTGVAAGSATVTVTMGKSSAKCAVVVADSSAILKEYNLEYDGTTEKEAESAKNKNVVKDIGKWHNFFNHTGLSGASFKNDTITLSFIKASKTVILRYQPFVAVGTEVKVSFTITLPEGVSSETFEVSVGDDVKSQILTSGENKFEGIFTVSAEFPLQIKLKVNGNGDVVISQIAVTTQTQSGKVTSSTQTAMDPKCYM